MAEGSRGCGPLCSRLAERCGCDAARDGMRQCGMMDGCQSGRVPPGISQVRGGEKMVQKKSGGAARQGRDTSCRYNNKHKWERWKERKNQGAVAPLTLVRFGCATAERDVASRLRREAWVGSPAWSGLVLGWSLSSSSWGGLMRQDQRRALQALTAVLANTTRRSARGWDCPGLWHRPDLSPR